MISPSLSNIKKSLTILPFLLAAIALPAQDPGFFLNDWQEKTAQLPTGEPVEKTANTPSVNISVDRGLEINKVPQYVYGNNAVTWDDGLRNNTTAMTDLNNLDPHVLRWPGGTLSNSYFWNVPYKQKPADVPASIDPWYGMDCEGWQMSVDEYYDLLSRTNSTGIICVNYSYARYGTGPNPVAKAAHMAAEWVRYDNGRSKFWEIGNENFGNWDTSYEIDPSINQDGQPQFISGQLYGEHCSIFIDSMKAAAAKIGVDIKIGVVAFDAETSWDPIQTVWNEQMMPVVGDKADYLVVHSYFTPYQENSTIGTILNSHDVPGEIMTVMVDDMAEAGKPMIPVAMTEWNIFAEGSMQQVSYINGMLAALVLGEFIQNDYGLGTRWDLVNNWSGGNDHGMFSVGGEPGVDPYNPRAAFFYMYYFQRYFGDRMVGSTVSGSANVIAFASTFTSGETGVVLVNKSRTAETASVDLVNGGYGLNYYYHTLTGGTDNGDFSRKVLINGIETDEEGGGPDEYATIKANSTKTDGGIVVDLPPLSVVYLMVEKKPPFSYVSSKIDTNTRVINIKFSEEVTFTSPPSGMEVILNGTTPLTIAGIEINADDTHFVQILLEQDVMHDDLLTLSYAGSEIVSSENVPVLPFTEEQVDNLIPGGPYSITFRFITQSTGEEIENCMVIFNNETKFTGINGQVNYTAMGNDYLLQAEKTHFLPVTDLPFTILSDTLVTITMDSMLYSVAFVVVDSASGEFLPFTTIGVSDKLLETDPTGSATFSLSAGIYSAQFSEQNHHAFQSEFQIESDTTLTVKLERSHAALKMQLRYNLQPVPGALVVLNEDSVYANATGTCTFASVMINSDLNYTIEKADFFPASSILNISSDTTIKIQMEKSVANITFLITSVSGRIMNAFATIDQDTARFDEAGSGKFYNIPKNQEVAYAIFSDNFETNQGLFYHEKDTTIQILLNPSGVFTPEKPASIRIYPNPSNGMVTIESNEKNITEVSILNITGKQVIHKTFGSPQQSIVLQMAVPPGVYILKTGSGKIYRLSKVIVY